MEDITEWINCPECGSDDVDIDSFTDVRKYRLTNECNDCGAEESFLL